VGDYVTKSPSPLPAQHSFTINDIKRRQTVNAPQCNAHTHMHLATTAEAEEQEGVSRVPE
jgi:hypothetical protein